MRAWTHAGIAAGLCTLLMACTAPLDVWLDLPPSEGAASLLIAVPDGDALEIFLADTQQGLDGVQLSLHPRSMDERPIEAAYFQAPLESVDLQAGWQSPANPLNPTRRLTGGQEAAFDKPLHSFVAELGESAQWQASAGLSAQIGSYEVRRPLPRCRGVHAPRVTKTIDTSIAWAVAVSTTQVLMGAYDRRTFILTTPTGELSEISINAPFTAAVFDDGWAYLGDANGQLWRLRGAPEGGLIDRVSLGEPLGETINAISAKGPADIFVRLRGGHLHHYDGISWQLAGSATNVGYRMVHAGPQEALITADAVGIVYNVTRSEMKAESVGPVGVLSLAWVPELGVLAGTSDGELLQRDGLWSWRLLGDKRYGWWLTDIAPHAGGVAFVLASGTIGGFHKDVGHCEDLFISAYVRDGRLIPQQDGLLFVGDLPGFDKTQATLLEPL